MNLYIPSTMFHLIAVELWLRTGMGADFAPPTDIGQHMDSRGGHSLRGTTGVRLVEGRDAGPDPAGHRRPPPRSIP